MMIFSTDCLADGKEQEDSDGGRHGASCSEHWGHLSRAFTPCTEHWGRHESLPWCSLCFAPQRHLGHLEKALGPDSWDAAWYWGYILVYMGPAKLL